MTPAPRELRWLLWDLDADEVDVDQCAAAVLGRVLEHGRLADVRMVLELYGRERVLTFFREGDHPVVSERTRGFWRAFFGADEAAATPDHALPKASCREQPGPESPGRAGASERELANGPSGP